MLILLHLASIVLILLHFRPLGMTLPLSSAWLPMVRPQGQGHPAVVLRQPNRATPRLSEVVIDLLE
eukprot:1431117-Karenia_brevis.AAC.1